MEELISAVRRAVESANWYAALFLALALPDICGWMESPQKGSRERYEEWFDRYMLAKYTAQLGPDRQKHIFLSGADCYALRCCALHEGGEEITLHRAREALDRFQFTAPDHRVRAHCNQIGGMLQLQIDVFCDDICTAVERWIHEKGSDPDVAARLKTLLRIYRLGASGGFIRFRGNCDST